MTEAVPFDKALRELMRLSGWNRADVIARPSDAAWAASAYIVACRRAIEVGER